MNIIISGASKGIGLAVAEIFAAEGANLFLCSRGEKGLYDAVAHLQSAYPQATVKARPADMSVPQQAKDFGAWCVGQAIPDILVNNAGHFIPGSVHNESEGTLEAMIAANLYSAYHLTRAVLPAMMDARKGHVFNICSIASLHAYANGGSYSISKFAMLGFSKNLREEMKPHGIKVTAVCPGATMTASWEGATIPASRIMEASDIARMILAASRLSPMADVEDIVMRPQLGDL